MIVVTGGAGFIGSNIVAALEARGVHDIVVCDELGQGDKWRNLAKHEIADTVPPEALFDVLAGTYGGRESEGLFDLFGGKSGRVDLIIHMGANSSTIETDADLVLAQNFRFTRRLWNWCAAHGTRFIYASSAATYGDGSQGFDDDGSIEALAKLRPLNLYGWSKHLFDRRAARLVAQGDAHPPQWAGLKFFNAYGPNEYHKGRMRSVVHQAYEVAAEGAPVRLFKSHRPEYENGGQLRDFVYIDDCIGVILWLIDHPGVNGVFNLGTGTARSFADLAAAVFAALDRDVRIDYIDMPEDIRPRYQYFTEARMDRLRAAGYDRPFTPLEQGVATYIKDYLATADPYR